MDAFSDALRSLRLLDFKPGLSERRGSWGTKYPKNAWDVVFYAVQGETCWLSLDTGEDFELIDGSICILPHGHAHSLRSDLNTQASPIRHLRPQGYHGLMQYGGTEGPCTRVHLGRFRLEHTTGSPLWAALPSVIHVRLSETPTWLDTLFAWFQEELTQLDSGYASVCSRIGELLIIQSIRIYVDNLAEDAPTFLGAMRDPQLLRVLNLMHDHIDEQWTLQKLAESTGMSRSRLAERFASCLGEGPMHYLTGWRMKQAAILLAETDLKISNIVEAVGYRSEPSFNIAFKRKFGLPPGRYRKEHQDTG